jgi:hypothetical protein
MQSRYSITWLIPAMWSVIRFFHNAAHLTLVTSHIMREELGAQAAPITEAIHVSGGGLRFLGGYCLGVLLGWFWGAKPVER